LYAAAISPGKLESVSVMIDILAMINPFNK